MKVDIVVDVGNSRIKWGRCGRDGVAGTASLPPEDPAAWEEQIQAWKLKGQLRWAVAGVHPARGERLADWIGRRGDQVCALKANHLPLVVRVDQPEKVGMDRLLDAVAANGWLTRGLKARPEKPAIIIDAGSAITVDLVDQAGAFRGGTIFPGVRLLTRSLHEHTALLPLVEINLPPPSLLGTSTPSAIAGGVYWGTAGAINALTSHFMGMGIWAPTIFLTGGDAPLFREVIDHPTIFWPEMTLEGIRLAAEALP